MHNNLFTITKTFDRYSFVAVAPFLDLGCFTIFDPKSNVIFRFPAYFSDYNYDRDLKTYKITFELGIKDRFELLGSLFFNFKGSSDRLSYDRYYAFLLWPSLGKVGNFNVSLYTDYFKFTPYELLRANFLYYSYFSPMALRLLFEKNKFYRQTYKSNIEIDMFISRFDYADALLSKTSNASQDFLLVSSSLYSSLFISDFDNTRTVFFPVKYFKFLWEKGVWENFWLSRVSFFFINLKSTFNINLVSLFLNLSSNFVNSILKLFKNIKLIFSMIGLTFIFRSYMCFIPFVRFLMSYLFLLFKSKWIDSKPLFVFFHILMNHWFMDFPMLPTVFNYNNNKQNRFSLFLNKSISLNFSDFTYIPTSNRFFFKPISNWFSFAITNPNVKSFFSSPISSVVSFPFNPNRPRPIVDFFTFNLKFFSKVFFSVIFNVLKKGFLFAKESNISNLKYFLLKYFLGRRAMFKSENYIDFLFNKSNDLLNFKSDNVSFFDFNNSWFVNNFLSYFYKLSRNPKFMEFLSIDDAFVKMKARVRGFRLGRKRIFTRIPGIKREDFGFLKLLLSIEKHIKLDNDLNKVFIPKILSNYKLLEVDEDEVEGSNKTAEVISHNLSECFFSNELDSYKKSEVNLVKYAKAFRRYLNRIHRFLVRDIKNRAYWKNLTWSEFWHEISWLFHLKFTWRRGIDRRRWMKPFDYRRVQRFASFIKYKRHLPVFKKLWYCFVKLTGFTSYNNLVRTNFDYLVNFRKGKMFEIFSKREARRKVKIPKMIFDKSHFVYNYNTYSWEFSKKLFNKSNAKYFKWYNTLLLNRWSWRKNTKFESKIARDLKFRSGKSKSMLSPFETLLFVKSKIKNKPSEFADFVTDYAIEGLDGSTISCDSLTYINRNINRGWDGRFKL